MIVECSYCHQLINRRPCDIKKSKKLFCDMQCYRKWMSIYQKGINHHCYDRVQISCDFCGKKIFKHKSRIKTYNYLFCNRQCKAQWNSKYRRGPSIYNWIKDRAKLKSRIRNTLECGYQWIQWRKHILDRDKICMLCGSDTDLVVHHIVTFATLVDKMTPQEHEIFINKNIVPNVFYDINNGICLCSFCHVHKVNGHEKEYEEVLRSMICDIIE